jgi:hypothetical protein
VPSESVEVVGTVDDRLVGRLEGAEGPEDRDDLLEETAAGGHASKDHTTMNNINCTDLLHSPDPLFFSDLNNVVPMYALVRGPPILDGDSSSSLPTSMGRLITQRFSSRVISGGSFALSRLYRVAKRSKTEKEYHSKY